jgi:predicted deacylase
MECGLPIGIFLFATALVCLISLLWILPSIDRRLTRAKPLKYFDIVHRQPGPFVCLVGGTHGNEPAGAVALLELAQRITIPRGKLRIIPAVNEWGLLHNNRYRSPLGAALATGDINRNYRENGAVDEISRKVLELTRGADLVIDFHEGWGFHQCQPASVGSTLTPTDFEPAPQVAAAAVGEINQRFGLGGCKKFASLRDESCTIGTTLACHMQRNARPYILVEITGQNDIQPLNLRVAQVAAVVEVAVRELYAGAPRSG